MTVKRVETTKTADTLLNQLVEKYGALMFHQSGGCCDGSSPMCYPIGDFKVGQRDVFLGYVGDTNIPFYIGGDQFEYWKHTHLTVDVVVGRGGGFSLESPEGKRFLIRSRLYSDAEWAILANEPVVTGAR